MAVVLFTRTLLVNYKADFCSFATFIYIISFLIVWIAPVFIVYGTNKAWNEVSLLSPTQANVKFKHNFILKAVTSDAGDILMFSTLPDYNDIFKDFLRTPLMKAIEVDADGDAVDDLLNLELSLPLTSSEVIRQMKILLFFEYRLEEQKFAMECMAYLDLVPDFLGSSIEAMGNLKLIQSKPLPNHLDNELFNVSVVGGSRRTATAYEIENILSAYDERSVRTEVNLVSFVSKMSADTSIFDARITVNYNKQADIIVRTAPSAAFKWFYVQYVYVFLLFYCALHRAASYTFANQLLATVSS